jgi:hypothetical protein
MGDEPAVLLYEDQVVSTKGELWVGDPKKVSGGHSHSRQVSLGHGPASKREKVGKVCSAHTVPRMDQALWSDLRRERGTKAIYNMHVIEPSPLCVLRSPPIMPCVCSCWSDSSQIAL